MKFRNHVGLLPPVQRSRLEKIRNQSKNWVPMWSRDADYEQFEVHGWPTNMAVDFGKRICTCGFLQHLTCKTTKAPTKKKTTSTI
ncbi:Transposon protein [Arachis hypogaea]|uniref:Transposon protein n=1 Tax=Arachis hypogaea TaxID=3818 RepID=A0A6B9V6D1_ARAHY|nr:Transposon protein [Arachis hypogaea]